MNGMKRVDGKGPEERRPAVLFIYHILLSPGGCLPSASHQYFGVYREETTPEWKSRPSNTAIHMLFTK